VVIAAILLFPWSLVLTAVIATVWPKARALARPRHLREHGAGAMISADAGSGWKAASGTHEGRR
jgi:hypothetical protein